MKSKICVDHLDVDRNVDVKNQHVRFEFIVYLEHIDFITISYIQNRVLTNFVSKEGYSNALCIVFYFTFCLCASL